MGVSRICKAGVQNFIVWIIMGSNLSLWWIWASPQENFEIWSALGAILGLF